MKNPHSARSRSSFMKNSVVGILVAKCEFYAAILVSAHLCQVKNETESCAK